MECKKKPRLLARFTTSDLNADIDKLSKKAIADKIEQLKSIALFSFDAMNFVTVKKIGSRFIHDNTNNKNACKIYVINTNDVGKGKKIEYIKWRDRYTVLYEKQKVYFYYLWYDNDRTAERLMLESMRVADMILKTSGIDMTPSSDFERYRCYVTDIYEPVKEGLKMAKKERKRKGKK